MEKNFSIHLVVKSLDDVYFILFYPHHKTKDRLLRTTSVKDVVRNNLSFVEK